MLRFDRYLVAPTRSTAIDLATGHPVDFTAATSAALFDVRRGRTLIDLESDRGRRIEVWERWTGRRPAKFDSERQDFIELLECARHGAPRAYDLSSRQPRDHAYLIRAFARDARIRGWLPLALELLGAISRQRKGEGPLWLADRSLVIFAQAEGTSGDGVLALLRLARRDARPHVLVRTLTRSLVVPPWIVVPGVAQRTVVHEEATRFGIDLPPADGEATVAREAAARWAVLVGELTGTADQSRHAVALADVLVAREQRFEAHAVLEAVRPNGSAVAGRRASIVASLRERAVTRAAGGLDADTGANRRGYEMVDDFVDVLRICQDIEDEQTALARVGAFLRDRLQASSVAFVVREGATPRVLARVGSESAGVTLAIRSIETGVPISPAKDRGPVESAWPVRHAAEVIGAVWCRWSAGTPIATQHASSLLGIAAAATAPSVRLAMAHSHALTDRSNPVPELVGDSLAMATVRDAIVRAAASPFPVVIEGESGSGKELAARAIHARSARRDRRFCPINCAALVDDLVEAELFGHVRGAFTGAASDRPGVFEEANGGTLFLDEVAELGGRVQPKLLRTLQEGEVRRLGENVVRKVDVRVVSATNRPLAREVAAGAFRADLWYRLDVIRISLPALRERVEDLPLLVSHLWRALTARTGSRATLAATTVAALAAYGWPGNIRELQNVLASMLVSAPRAGCIGPSALPVHIARVAALEKAATLADARRQFDERFVRAALAKAGGQTASAARQLGLSRQGLSKLMGRLGIHDARGEAAPEAKVQ